MPCRDGGPSPEEEVREYYNKFQEKKAMLCGVMTAAEKAGVIELVLDHYSSSESGVQKGRLKNWWRQHKREDEERRERARIDQQEKQVKQAILDKLTPDERKILGL